MTTKTSLSRRALMVGVAASGATLLGAAPAPASTGTPIASLWAEAEVLGARLIKHRAAIAEAALNGGIPGWMRLGGEANALAEARYGKLIAILNTPARDAGDLATIARVTRDQDITEGARAWAGERLADAAASLAA